ncbi:MAG TPA: pitrilysin family protein [Pyrinomonadaceae bacterium]|jgi:predicted Zn-dependent peptidase|nr:pitrilysin family protein [Pyrinomonadaceae bacterium]
MSNRMRNLRKNLKPLAALLLLATLTLSPNVVPAQTQQIPAHPRELKYTTLTYTPPKREQYRHVLSNGVVAYLVEDHDLPLVNVSTFVHTGSYLDPAGKEGLAALTGTQMRVGGTTSKTAEEFDEAADFLAANITNSIGGTQGTANLNLLAKDVDQGLALYFDMLRNPRFQEDRIKLAKSQLLQNMERRNDRTDAIETREWTRLMNGTDHFTTKETTKASIDSISREDLVAFHQRYYQPAGFSFAVSGDFNTKEMLAKLEAATKGWPSNKQAVPAVPKPTNTLVAGVYAVHKADVNQGRVSIGHIGGLRDSPDAYALEIMNDILGGGGFTSRIMSRVRSDEGLAYSAGSSFGLGIYYPGSFRASFQSKNPTTSQAIDIVMEEINRVRTTKVTTEELETAKNQAIETFPQIFSSATRVAGTFAQDEYTKRPADYWLTYRERIAAITADDVQRVAQKYLQPDKLVVLVVGNIEEITKGNPDKPQYSLLKIAKDGQIRRLPLPDPLTMVYPSNP